MAAAQAGSHLPVLPPLAPPGAATLCRSRLRAAPVCAYLVGSSPGVGSLCRANEHSPSLPPSVQASTAAPPSSTTAPLAWSWSTACQCFALLRGLTLAAGTAVAGAVAASGLAVLLFLAVTASLAPASDTFSRPLSLDFGQPDLAGQAVFLPEAQLTDGLPLSAAQRNARWVHSGSLPA